MIASGNTLKLLGVSLIQQTGENDMSKELYWLRPDRGDDRAALGALHPRPHHGARRDGRDRQSVAQRQAAIGLGGSG